jgi:hypothetical protein
MNLRLTIALPLLLAAAPAHASHWEMTCPNVRADLPPDTISSDPERGYLLVSGASGNDPRDPLQLHHAVEAAPVVYQYRNVRCVLLKPK